MKFLSVQNWDRFQHYKDRDPPWVKLYRDTLTSESWVLGSDLSRLVQVASILLAPRYGNQIPYRFDLLKKVISLDCGKAAFENAIKHLVSSEFLEIHEVNDEREQSASSPLATCTSETEERQRRSEQIREEQDTVPQERDRVSRVFTHWAQTHNHPKAKLDPKRHKLITQALKSYDEATLCEAIAGYLNSPFHAGQNDRNTAYTDIEHFLRTPKHIEAGLQFARNPPRPTLSRITQRNANATSDWIPPEARNAN